MSFVVSELKHSFVNKSLTWSHKEKKIIRSIDYVLDSLHVFPHLIFMFPIQSGVAPFYQWETQVRSGYVTF